MNFFSVLSADYGIDLNKQQKEAVMHLEGPAIVLAGPGSGKTTVIISRLAYMLLEMGVPPSNILSVTFNRAAALEMKERFNKILKEQIGGNIRFSTLHSFCYSVVRDYEKMQNSRLTLIEGNNSEYSNKYIILRNIYMQINESRISDDELEQLSSEIGYVKNKMIKNISNINFETRNFSRIFSAYESYKKQNLLMDYDDMLTYAYAILLKCPNILNYYKNRYKFIQVDEGQDLSKVQFEIIKLLAWPSNNVFIVADDDQSIYGFRGAQPEYILNAKNEFNNTKIYYLEYNYRSSENIVSLSSRFIKTNKKRYDKYHKAINKAKEDPKIITAKDRYHQTRYVINRISEISNDKNKSIGILYRNNFSSILLIEYLEQAGITYRLRQGKVHFFDHWFILDVLSFLRFAVDQTDADSFMRIYFKLNCYISRDAAEYVSALEYNRPILDRILNLSILKPYQREKIVKTKMDFNRIAGLSPADAMDYIDNVFNLVESTKDYCQTIGQNHDNLKNMLEILRIIASEYNTIESFLTRVLELENIFQYDKIINNKKNSKITLSTIHSAKGLEFDYVILIDLINDEFPGVNCLDKSSSIQTNKEENINMILEEERRLFYVGITRAKSHLYLVSPGNVAGTRAKRTIFIDELLECTKKDIVHELRKGNIIHHKYFGTGVVETVDTRINEKETILVVDFNGDKKKLSLNACLNKGIITVPQTG